MRWGRCYGLVEDTGRVFESRKGEGSRSSRDSYGRSEREAEELKKRQRTVERAGWEVFIFVEAAERECFRIIQDSPRDRPRSGVVFLLRGFLPLTFRSRNRHRTSIFREIHATVLGCASHVIQLLCSFFARLRLWPPTSRRPSPPPPHPLKCHVRKLTGLLVETRRALLPIPT